MSRHTASPASSGELSAAASASAGGAGILGMLTPLLDKNRDGSVVDDILGSASRFFQK